MIGVLIKKETYGPRQTCTKGRRCEDTQGEDSCVSGVMHSQAVGHQELLATPGYRKGKGGPSSGAVRER